MTRRLLVALVLLLAIAPARADEREAAFEAIMPRCPHKLVFLSVEGKDIDDATLRHLRKQYPDRHFEPYSRCAKPSLNVIVDKKTKARGEWLDMGKVTTHRDMTQDIVMYAEGSDKLTGDYMITVPRRGAVKIVPMGERIVK